MMRPVLVVVLGFVMAHNILYTYVAPLLAAARAFAEVEGAQRRRQHVALQL